MKVEIAILISIVSVAFAIYFGIKSNSRQSAKEIEERVARDTRVDMKLDSIFKICSDFQTALDSISMELKRQDKTISELERNMVEFNGRLELIESRLGKE